MRWNAPDLGDQRREPGISLEEVLDRDVHGPRLEVLLADRPRDHGGVGRQRAGVVGDEQRATLRRHVLHPVCLAPKPVAIEELDQGAIEEALDPLRAPPVGDAALWLERREQLPHAIGRQLLACRLRV